MLKNKYVKGGIMIGVWFGMWLGAIGAQWNWMIPIFIGWAFGFGAMWVVRPD